MAGSLPEATRSREVPAPCSEPTSQGCSPGLEAPSAAGHRSPLSLQGIGVAKQGSGCLCSSVPFRSPSGEDHTR